jgi:hypothetical protein
MYFRTVFSGLYGYFFFYFLKKTRPALFLPLPKGGQEGFGRLTTPFLDINLIKDHFPSQRIIRLIIMVSTTLIIRQVTRGKKNWKLPF